MKVDVSARIEFIFVFACNWRTYDEVQDEVRLCMTVDENTKVSEDKFYRFREVLEKYGLKISRAKAKFLECRLLK